MATGELKRSLPAFSAAIPVAIVYFAVLGIVLTAAGPNGLDLSTAQASGWIAVLYGWPTALALILTIRYRQPLLLTGNIFAIIFFVSLGHRLSFAELAGAAVVVALEDLDRRRLAGPVGAEEAEDLAGPDLEVDPAHRLVLAVGLAEPPDAYRRLRHPRARYPTRSSAQPPAFCNPEGDKRQGFPGN